MTTIFTARRLNSDGQSIITKLLDAAGVELCWLLEPGLERAEHPAIPAGRYELKLHPGGNLHWAYQKDYGPAFHKGMVEVCAVPGRSAILIHVGNKIDDTQGCLLTGSKPVEPRLSNSRHWEVVSSRLAYNRVYPLLRDAILAGPTFLDVLALGAP